MFEHKSLLPQLFSREESHSKQTKVSSQSNGITKQKEAATGVFL